MPSPFVVNSTDIFVAKPHELDVILAKIGALPADFSYDIIEEFKNAYSLRNLDNGDPIPAGTPRRFGIPLNEDLLVRPEEMNRILELVGKAPTEHGYFIINDINGVFANRLAEKAQAEKKDGKQPEPPKEGNQ